MKEDTQKLLKYVGERCAKLRKANGYTQSEAAKLAGISARTLGSYERGEREMNSDTAITLARIYHSTLTKLTDYKNALDKTGVTVKKKEK